MSVVLLYPNIYHYIDHAPHKSEIINAYTLLFCGFVYWGKAGVDLALREYIHFFNENMGITYCTCSLPAESGRVGWKAND